ncbi:MAG: ABC transporter permease [Clostridia bacterium]|nr:ABC transporter permease [Clostridia bacterium]
MKTLNFANRNLKELIRDPITIIFAIIFPECLLVLMSFINRNIPIDLFSIEKLSPGIAFFGLSFLSMFTAINISSDMETSFLTRLFSTTMKARNFIFGYVLPNVLIGIVQTLICFASSIAFGLKAQVSLVGAVAVSAVCSVLFVSIGICLGCVLSNKASGGVSSIVIQLSAWLSGIWFDIKLVGNVYQKICEVLPFYHGVEAIKAAINLDLSATISNLLWIIGYTIIFMIISTLLFKKKMK